MIKFNINYSGDLTLKCVDVLVQFYLKMCKNPNYKHEVINKMTLRPRKQKCVKSFQMQEYYSFLFKNHLLSLAPSLCLFSMADL